MAEVPQVYNSIAAVLSALSVERGGLLPGNMGGKPYVTASDLNLEIKRQFVANSLILLPNEKVIKHEAIPGQRLTIAIMIEGAYTIVSTEDGSSVTVSGVGDGVALGTAVSSNIASTNALKNALLRTFLVTEQSVEDAAKSGIDESAQSGPTKAQQNIAKASDGAKTAPTGNQSNGTVNELQNKIKAAAQARKDAGESDFSHMAFAKAFLKNRAQGWVTDEVRLTEVLEAIKGGVVA